MATVPEKLAAYAKMENIMPPDEQCTGCVQGDDRLVILGFKTERELITEIGYLSSDAKLPILHACMNALCELMKGKAVVTAGLPQRNAIAKLLSDNGTLSEADQSFAIMAELALNYAVCDYASRCKE